MSDNRRCGWERVCPHWFEPVGCKECPSKRYSDVNTDRKMFKLCQQEKRYHIAWGVVNPGNALCAAIFETKKKAETYQKNHASAYVVVRVVVSPLYSCDTKKQEGDTDE